MSVPQDLREGIKQLLVDAGVITAPAVFWRRLPDSPDQALAISWYPVPLPYRHRVQVRCRGTAKSSSSAEDLADAVRTALHGQQDLQFGSTRVELITFASGASLGPDATDREEFAVNVQLTTSDPSTSLVD